MALEAFQREAISAHRLASGERENVYVRWQGSEFEVKLNPFDQAHPQEAESVVLYVNEGGDELTGDDIERTRDLIVRWHAPTSPAARVPRDSEVSVFVGTPRWKVSASPFNIADSVIESAERAQNGAADGARGPEVTLRTSICSGDVYLVTAAAGRGRPHLSHLVIYVRKRIRYRYVEMQRDGAERTYGIPRALERARDYFRDEFSIELVAAGSPSSVAFSQNLTSSQCSSHFGVQSLRRELTIATAHALSLGGQVAGLGGSNMAAVALDVFRQGAEAIVNLQRARSHYGPTPQGEAQFLAQQRQLSPGWDESDDEFARNVTGPGAPNPVDAVRRQVFATLVHEICHAFGLVPNSASWRDQNQSAHHCRRSDCVMFWRVDAPGGATSWLPDDQPIKFGQTERLGQIHQPRECALALMRAPLRDIRNLP